MWAETKRIYSGPDYLNIPLISNSLNHQKTVLIPFKLVLGDVRVVVAFDICNFSLFIKDLF